MKVSYSPSTSRTPDSTAWTSPPGPEAEGEAGRRPAPAGPIYSSATVSV
jgi:hypothetical protein